MDYSVSIPYLVTVQYHLDGHETNSYLELGNLAIISRLMAAYVGIRSLVSDHVLRRLVYGLASANHKHKAMLTHE